MMRYMESHYKEDIGIDDVAKYVGYNARYCNSVFKAHYGETIGEYLRFLRMREAKRLLCSGRSVGYVAKHLSYKPRGFFYTFQKTFGTSPTQFIKDGKTFEPYVKRYEYDPVASAWGSGENPTADGLWEFSYYNPKTMERGLMLWDEDHQLFGSPDTYAPHYGPNYFCRNREQGYSVHPGRVTHGVRSFIAPHSGTVRVFFSVGRDSPIYKKSYPSVVQLYHNDLPLGEPLVLKTVSPHYLTATLRVRKDDRIRLHVDSGGNQRRCAVNLYRQLIEYTQIDE